MSEDIRLRFACLIMPGRLEKQALMFARSIRSFGGRFKSSMITMVTARETAGLSPSIKDKLTGLDVEICDLDISEPIFAFPFGAKVMAAARAEKLAFPDSELLIWMDTDSIFIREPEELIIPKNKILGYRPVDHTLIASQFDRPLDDFWRSLYKKCGISEENLSPMVTSVDQVTIRPYFNAGMLVVRPQATILGSWSTIFIKYIDDEDFSIFYHQNPLYKIFFHQAVLTCAILSTLSMRDLYQLPHLVNYPLHLHAEYPAHLKADYMNDLVSCRYDTALQDDRWRAGIRIKGQFKKWLKHQETELLLGDNHV